MNQNTHSVQAVGQIISPSWIVTLDKRAPLLTEHSIIIEQGRIIDILPHTDAMARYQTDSHYTLPGQVVMPGLINLHSHAPMSLLRGYADDMPLMPWLNDYIWPAENALLNSEFVYDATLLSCAEMLQGGVTTFNDMYFFPKATADAVRRMGIRANIGLVVIDFPSAYGADADDYLQQGFEAHDSWRDDALITTSLAPHAPYTVGNETFEKVLTYADQLSLTIHTHLHETKDEIAQSLDQYGVRPIERLHGLGLLSPQLIAAHGVHLNPQERELLAQYGCHIAHNPASNAKLGSGVANTPAMLDASINVGIGTDGAASNNRTDLFAEMRLASMLAKSFASDATVLPAQQLIEMATINGARALGLESEIGSIAVGKQADLVAVNVTAPDIAPCYDPLSHLVYACGREHVTHTWVAGELRYHEGNFSGVELAELKSIIYRWQPQIASLNKGS